MALSSTAITTRRRAKGFLRLNDADPSFQRPSIDIYHNAGNSATAATIEVRAGTIELVITNGGDAGTDSLNLTAAANDTLDELVSVINALAKGWVAVALYYGDADSDDLIETASVSAYGISNRLTLDIVNNRFIELLIEAATIEIETWLGRDIASRNYTELHNIRRAGGIKEIVLRHPDVSAVTRVSLDSSRAMSAEYTGAAQSARIEVSDTGVRTISQSGAITDATDLFTANITVAAMAVAVNARTDWTATSINDGPSLFLVREGVRDALNIVVDLLAWDDFEADYVVDYEAGTIDFGSFQWPFGLSTNATEVTRLQIDYTAGFATIPADIDLIAVELVASLFHNVARDDTLQSESLGDYSYTLRAGNGQSVEWQRRLEKYRRFLP